MRKDKIQKKGIVIESLPDASFRVQGEDGRIFLCYLAGKLRLHHIKVLPGDRVIIEVTPYDEKRGRIIIRK